MVADTAGTSAGLPAHPARFCSAPARNARIARPLRLVAGVRRVDEDLLDLLGRRMMTRDELGAELAAAVHRPRGDPQRVTKRQIQRALAEGTVDDDPPALRRFLTTVERTPDWLDPELVERGARASRRLGRSRIDVLLQLSLIGGYRFAGPADLLVATGGLTGASAIRRLGETETWGAAVSAPGGMRRDGEGFRLTLHVRVMHALVNRSFETNRRWDAAELGLPVNRSDVAATLGLFSSTPLLGARLLGRVVTPAESRAVMHMWKYVGWLMGVDEDWLFDTEREQNVFNAHVLLAQAGPTPAGVVLAGALVDGHRALPGWGGLRGRWEHHRLLAMLRLFLGIRGMRDLELPVVTPWVIAPMVVANLGLSGVLGRTRGGRRLLERIGDRATDRELSRWFGDGRAEVGV